MSLVMLIINMDDTAVNVALPTIQYDLNISLSRLQWIFTANALPATSFVLSTGTLADIYGHKRIFLWGLFCYGFGCLICGIAAGLGVLLVGRAFQGLGDAALVQASLSIMTDTFPKENEKAKAIGIWTAVSGVALVTGPVIGGLLVDKLGWQSIFFMNLPLAIFTFWLTLRVVKEVKNPTQQSVDVPGLVLSIIFLSSFIYALNEVNHGVWRSPLIIGLLAIAGISLFAFLMIESHSSHPMLPLNLFRNLNFTILNIVSILAFLTLITLLFGVNLFLQQIQGYSAVETGIRFLPFNGAFIVASLVSGWLVARLGWRFAIVTGLMLMCITTFSFVGVNADTRYEAIWGRLVVYGFGAGSTLAPMSSCVMNSVPIAKSGIAAAANNTCSRIGWIIGVTLQGTILTQLLTSNLKRSFVNWGIPTNLQNTIIANALQGGAKIPANLPSNISNSIYQQTFNNAFVSGLHVSVIAASIVSFAGVLLILIFVPSEGKKVKG